MMRARSLLNYASWCVDGKFAERFVVVEVPPGRHREEKNAIRAAEGPLGYSLALRLETIPARPGRLEAQCEPE